MKRSFDSSFFFDRKVIKSLNEEQLAFIKASFNYFNHGQEILVTSPYFPEKNNVFMEIYAFLINRLIDLEFIESALNLFLCAKDDFDFIKHHKQSLLHLSEQYDLAEKEQQLFQQIIGGKILINLDKSYPSDFELYETYIEEFPDCDDFIEICEGDYEDDYENEFIRFRGFLDSLLVDSKQSLVNSKNIESLLHYFKTHSDDFRTLLENTINNLSDKARRHTPNYEDLPGHHLHSSGIFEDDDDDEFMEAAHFYQLIIKLTSDKHILANANYGLGLLYFELEQYEKSFDYMHKAAELEDPRAMYQLALDYKRGNAEVDRDLEEAYFWFSQSAKQKKVEAYDELGSLCCDNELKSVGLYDLDEAIKWLKLSIENNHNKTYCCSTLIFIYKLKKDINNALFYFNQQEEKYYNDFYNVGCIYDAEGNDDQAFQYFQKAYENNPHIDYINYFLGESYLFGLGTAIDYSKAFNLLLNNKKYDQGRNNNHLGWFYKTGKGTEKNLSNAFNCYRLSADLSDKYGQYNLAHCYLEGLGTERNNKKAFNYFMLAAKQNHLTSQLKVAECYKDGIGILENYIQAYAWSLIYILNDETKFPNPGKKLKIELEKLMTKSDISAAQKLAENLQKEIKDD